MTSFLIKSLRALATPAALAVLLGAQTASADAPREQWHADIGGGYAILAQRSQALERAIGAYCLSADDASFEQARQAWQEAFFAWQRVRYVDFGPIEQNSLAWQFQFWPDSKNLIAQKSKRWIKDPEPVTAARLAGDSVAVKGFPAMEYLLFEIASNDQRLDSKACELLTAVADHHQANAETLNANWQAFGPHYLRDEQYNSTTIIAAMHSLEILKDARLGGPMGTKGNSGKRNPWLADAWRSGQSLRGIEASLRGLEELFLPGLRQLMLPAGKRELFEQFERQLGRTLARLQDLPEDISPLLKDDEGYRSLQLLQIDMEKLTTLLNVTIAAELGIVRGFNSSDGD